ncbi:ChrR family anti-sigma-E factor [Microbulbifer agarilyticus]|uniref:ChrR family anti-sigma-E factor n=1 Tax=Microbulbifer agarilyticus TaxID=260552 RepID=UPI001C93FD6A|nr:ChrR family anti-sigma-E factor [Microbulbifer agarilyticus]MBY6210796.1 ChrR family anti-sigma-E factor [Microbulbifer agarilyticus]MCA0892015.1 ChrR family anti-sigma-E factor [Microbulbifer agarilyticus]
MIHYHPDNNMLLEYASGSLSWAQSLAVSAHIHFCPQCAAQMKMLNNVGGNLLSASAPVASVEREDSAIFGDLMQRIEARENEEDEEPAAPAKAVRERTSRDPAFSAVPPVVKKLLAQNPVLKWRRLSKGLKEARLKTGQNELEVSFHRIAPGSKVAEHDHRGKEITLVLYGSFSDGEGVYSTGDFLVREPGQVHRPTATQDQECLCLSVVEAPVALTGLLGRMMNPFLSLKPQ